MEPEETRRHVERLAERIGGEVVEAEDGFYCRKDGTEIRVSSDGRDVAVCLPETALGDPNLADEDAPDSHGRGET